MNENKEKKQKIKKKKTLGYVLGKIADWLVYPIILVAFFSSFMMLVSKTQSIMTPIFGNYVVRIMSGSMRKSGFERGDIVTVKKYDSSSYRVGDIIAYYSFYDAGDNAEKTSLYVEVGYGEVEGKLGQYPKYQTNEHGELVFNQDLLDSTPKNPREDRITRKQVADNETHAYFHEVIGVYLEKSTGMLFYETKGSSNNAKDSFLVREDYVLGKYRQMPTVVKEVMTFCSSTWGMLILVVFPLSLMVLFELLNVLEQVSNLILERKVLRRQVPFDSPECIKANIGIEMQKFDKAYYYDVMPKEYKNQVFEYLWGWHRDSLRRKDVIVYQTASKAVEKYDFENPKIYWEAFLSDAKSDRMKKRYIENIAKARDDKYAEVVVKDYQNSKETNNKKEKGFQKKNTDNDSPVRTKKTVPKKKQPAKDKDKELLDISKKYDMGEISKEEYDKRKKEILGI